MRQPVSDDNEAALFVFDKVVRTAQPFTGEFDTVRSSFASVKRLRRSEILNFVLIRIDVVVGIRATTENVVVPEAIDTAPSKGVISRDNRWLPCDRDGCGWH